jgi:hypothetical protein
MLNINGMFFVRGIQEFSWERQCGISAAAIAVLKTPPGNSGMGRFEDN